MKKGVWKRLIIFGILLGILLPLTYAQTVQDLILVNSKRWQDVYSSTLYGRMVGINHNFLVSERHALIYLQTLDPEVNPNILLMESDQIYFNGFQDSLEDAGFDVERTASNNNNLNLAQKIVDEKGYKTFLIVDDAYGYNAISAAPYAMLTKSFVLFVNDENVDIVEDFLQNVEPEKVEIIGHVSRAVQTMLEQFNAEKIAEGSRFEINIDLVRRFHNIRKTKQVVITNGEFIEEQFFLGAEPVIFIGKQNIPDITKQYLQGSDVEVAVLVGNDLVQTGVLIKRELGITTFIKFARSARIPSGILSQVEGLDLFYLPQYELGMDIESIKYNELSNQLEVTYANKANIAIYFRSSLTVDDQNSNTSLGDDAPIFMDRNEKRTITYDYSTESKDLKVKSLVIFGESANSMEKAIEKTMAVELVRILDSTNLDLLSAFYTKKERAIGIVVKNTEENDLYATAEIVDLLVDGLEQTIGSKRTIRVPANQEKTLYVRTVLTNLDLEENPDINAIVHYGQREDGLIKQKQGRLDLEIKGFEYLTESIAVAAAVVIIWLIFFLRRKKKKRRHHHH